MKKGRKLLLILGSSLLLASCGEKTEPQNESQQEQKQDGAASENEQKQDDAENQEPEEKICPAGFTGVNCDQCVDSRFTGENCSQCSEITYGPDCQLFDSVTDQDGNTYKTVIINDQEWMAENCRRETGTFYYPNNDSTYGLLYDWDTAITICPSGWRLPTKQEFDDLLTYVDNNKTSRTNFLALIAKSTAWTNYRNQGGDYFGFGGLPEGYYYSGRYYNFGNFGYFWSSTENNSSRAYNLRLGSGKADMYNDLKISGCSVRCLKD